MARVGIVTFHNSPNYGAVLQAYGLGKAVQSLGHDVQIIDYLSPAQKRRYCPDGLRTWVRRMRRPITYSTHERRFQQFRQYYLPLSRRAYTSLDGLVANPPQVDVLICGSDQVWNIHTPSCGGFDPVFFLGFPARDGARRVSYAACMGDTQPAELPPAAKHFIERLDHISVRDGKTAAAIFELTGREATHVLDPSCLTDYSPITPSPMERNPYVFLYHYGHTPWLDRCLSLIQKQMNIPVVSVFGRSGARVRHMSTAGPLQWLSLMRHAEFVITNSFHGTCFSLIWRKQFVVLPIGGGRQFRLEGILQIAGLEDRLACDEEQLRAALATSVNHEASELRLGEARERSFSFLQEALG